MSIEGRLKVWGNPLRGPRIFPGVKVMSNHSEENFLPVDSPFLYSIANRKLIV
jgi:hypothetical protein